MSVLTPQVPGSGPTLADGSLSIRLILSSLGNGFFELHMYMYITSSCSHLYMSCGRTCTYMYVREYMFGIHVHVHARVHLSGEELQCTCTSS